MLEFLFLAFLSDGSQAFLAKLNQVSSELPRVEIFSPAKVPLKPQEKVAPKLLDEGRVSVLAFDEGSGKILFEENMSRVQPIASLTKLMSFLVIMENHSLDEIVTVPLKATQVSGAKIDVYQYERLSVQTLLEAILIPSANDAMMALAIFDSGTEEAFVKKMNEKAESLGLTSAKFYNSSGLDIFDEHEGGYYGNQMSALDVLNLARVALNNDFFRETVAKSSFWGTSVDGRFSHEKVSTNQLLGTFINSKGVKTGYTELAGECLVNLSEDPDGNEVLTVVLGSSDRFGETRSLVSWVMDAFVWK